MYNIDPTSLTISGFSAGGFMAAQLAIAYSSNFFNRFGIFAGGPYDCARIQDFWTTCMHNSTPSIEASLSNIKKWSAEGKIDDFETLSSSRSRVYVQTGVLDEIVGVGVTGQLVRQLEELGVLGSGLKYVELEGAAHVFPRDFEGQEGEETVPCNESVHPYIADCGYDGAGEMLKWLYEDETFRLRPRRARGSLSGVLKKYEQTGALGAIGLAERGYLYVPKSCAGGRNSGHGVATSCKLHVALHGCTMSYLDIGETWVRDAGYLEWADTNDMVVVFPQAGHDEAKRPIWNGTEYPGGAIACFDWIGWSGEDADWKGGAQMQAILNVVEKLLREDGPEGTKPIWKHAEL
ncbi:hypothetical protein CBER1_09140 [Cercospora berteroae]|uniref:Uncharacterized protein n=1 Tax=Cercospora berteroae TaxID=357750 RepID=A0A2S6BWF2_9PEZI|nr:hypothetical protein CBER1_09140 [Cercospora berteroae]